jgi:hypothetical protein
MMRETNVARSIGRSGLTAGEASRNSGRMRFAERSTTARERSGKTVALSIRQPWVELILAGRKTIEVRTWSTKHRGTLWLHAGKRVDVHACRVHHLSPDSLDVGALVGVAELVDCIAFDAATWEALRPTHLNLVEFDREYFGWVLRAARRVPATPHRGSLGLMTLPPAVVSRVST